MVAIWTSLPAFKAEFKTRLRGLTVSGRKDKSFLYREASTKNISTIQEDTGRARLFQFGTSAVEKYVSVGSGTVRTKRIIQLQIMYPTHGSWPEVMESDYQLLRKDFENHPTAVSGIELAEMNLEKPFEIEQVSNEWLLVTWLVSVWFSEN